MAKILMVLGAGGRFGRAATAAFGKAGWRVKALVRKPSARFGPNVETVIADVFDADALVSACGGCDVIINALNPPYERWQRDLPLLTANVIAAAKQSGATVMIPGNVYNYGTALPPILKETTPQNAGTKKGRLRIDMERAYAEAAHQGVRTVILRGGDFMEAEQTGNWFDSYIANKAGQGKTTYPGPLNVKHAWAYLPDMARAMVHLADKRQELDAFAEFGFAGYGLTGHELVAAIERATGVMQKISGMPWFLMRLMAIFSPRIGEVLEMCYLWNAPHEIDDSQLAKTIPDFVPTPLDQAMQDIFAATAKAAPATIAPASPSSLSGGMVPAERSPS